MTNALVRTWIPTLLGCGLLLGVGCQGTGDAPPPPPAPGVAVPQPAAPTAPALPPAPAARKIDTSLPADQQAPLMADMMVKGDAAEIAGLVKTIKAGNDAVFAALATAAELVCPQAAGAEYAACRPAGEVVVELRAALIPIMAGRYQFIERPGPAGLRRTNATRAFLRLGGQLAREWPTRYEMEQAGYKEQVAFQLKHGMDVTIRHHLDANLEVPNRPKLWNIARDVQLQFEGHEEGFAAKDLSKGWRNKPFDLKQGVERVLEFAAAKPEYLYGLRAIRFPKDNGAQLFVQIETASSRETSRFVSWQTSPTGDGFQRVELDGSTNVHQLLGKAYAAWRKKPKRIEEYAFLFKLR